MSRGLGETVYKRNVRPQLNDFIGAVFEKICRSRQRCLIKRKVELTSFDDMTNGYNSHL